MIETTQNIDCVVQRNEGYSLIKIGGKLISQESCNLLKQAADKELGDGVVNLIVDMKQLEFLNSSGLNGLIGMLTRTRNAGGDLYLTHVSDKVNQLFIMTKLVNVFNIKSSVNEALAALKAAETEN